MKQAIQRVLDEVYRRRFSLFIACIAVFVLADSLKNRDYILGIGVANAPVEPMLAPLNWNSTEMVSDWASAFDPR